MYKIGVFGSKENQGNTLENKAKELGILLAKKGLVIITGAGSGVPYTVAVEAYKNGGEVWGYSIATDIESHKKWLPNLDYSIYKKLIFVPETFELADDFISRAKYRNIISTYNCDAGIIISGDWGALDEFAHLMAYKKIVGVLTETGEITNFIQSLFQSRSELNKDDNVIFENSAEVLIEKIKNKLT